MGALEMEDSDITPFHDDSMEHMQLASIESRKKAGAEIDVIEMHESSAQKVSVTVAFFCFLVFLWMVAGRLL
jgi:hypothetical protein